MSEDSGTDSHKKIYELTEIYDERSGYGRRATDGKNPQQVVMIDGRGYERIKARQRIHERVHDLTDIVEDHSCQPQINEALMKQSLEIIEKIARELIPGIAERVIREEIEKIKNQSKNRSSHQD